MYAMELTNPSTVTGTGACTLAHKGARPGWAGTGTGTVLGPDRLAAVGQTSIVFPV